ncbi:MAG: endonuclease MutS2 [Deltaproteobacteria bacterium]|nr:endonuclease MutS2 [Deltaproteobacteria bacterium]
MVEQNNRLRIAQLQVAEEERRILARLSSWIGEELCALTGSLQVLAHIDRLFAAGALGQELRSTTPVISEGEIVLHRARHPLLVLAALSAPGQTEGLPRLPAGAEGHLASPSDTPLPAPGSPPRTVVANDLLLDPQSRVLVISGPNTGGKTVTLKTVGLCALMLRAGLLLPVDAGSRFPLFDAVFADIGDLQSIARSLSTFSAHLTNLASILGQVDRQSLVLLDELVVGTDPREGEALASAILRWLADRRAWTLVTTHYEGLKALALEDPRFVNASMGYDPRTLAPTFRLYLGQPGRSSPLDIAARLGLPVEILALARSLLPQENLYLEHAIRSLEQSRTALEQERDGLSLARRQAEQAAREASAQKAAWQKQRQLLVQQGREETVEALRAARAELAAAVRRLQQGPIDHELIRQQRRRVETIGQRAERLAAPGRPGEADGGEPPLTVEEIRVGLPVLLPDRGLCGQVEGVDVERGQATVRAGALRIAVPWSELRHDRRGRPGEPAAATRRPGTMAAAGEPAPSASFSLSTPGSEEHLLQTTANSCDLRGLRVDEALAEVERFMDRNLAMHSPYVFLIHGHGTGALKQAVREYLEASPYVGRWRPGQRGEGGDGVSVVWLDRR